MKYVLGLDALIREKSWDCIVSLDPSLITKTLSFENVRRLATEIYQGDDATSGYGLRLLYQLKGEFKKKWESCWKNEMLLAELCVFAYRYHEEYYAYRRAARLITPMPTKIALRLASTLDMPDSLMSPSEAIRLYLYAIQEYPYTNALRGLKNLYQDIPGKEAEVERLSLLIDRMDDQTLSEPIGESIGPEQPYDFSQAAKTKITIQKGSSQHIKSSIRLNLWTNLLELDPKNVVENISFQDSLRLAYRFVQMDAEFQEYAVRLLYALRYYCFGPWSKDWRNETLLGHACEVTGKTDEQFGAFDQACFFASEIPASLRIAVVRASLASDPPPLSTDQVIDLLQNALKENMYVDALQLLKQVYAHTGQQEKEVEVARSIASLKGQGAHSPSLLPACVTEPFDGL